MAVKASARRTYKRKVYAGNLVSQKGLGDHLFIGREVVSKLISSGVLPQGVVPKGGQRKTWNQDECRRLYLKSLKDKLQRRGRPRGSEGEGTLTTKRLEFESLRADKLRIEIDVLKGSLIPALDAERMLSSVIKVTQTKFRNLARKAARKFGLTPKVSKALQSLVDTILGDLAVSKLDFTPFDEAEDEKDAA